MATRAGERPGLAGAAKLVADKVSAIVRLELALAAAEIKEKLQKIQVGIGLLVAAALFGFFAIGFGLATIAAGLATVLPTWLSLLIVMAGLAILTAVLALLGRSSIQKGTPPVPEQAIAEAKLTTEALKNGHH
jgi:hypothetical protein